jgi:Nuclear protein Es2
MCVLGAGVGGRAARNENRYLQAQAEYMEAVARNDHVKIRELQIRYCTQRSERRTSPFARPGTSSTVAGGRGLLAPSPSVFDPDTPGPSVDAFDARSVQSTPYANRDGDNESLVSPSHSFPPPYSS